MSHRLRKKHRTRVKRKEMKTAISPQLMNTVCGKKKHNRC